MVLLLGDKNEAGCAVGHSLRGGDSYALCDAWLRDMSCDGLLYEFLDYNFAVGKDGTHDVEAVFRLSDAHAVDVVVFNCDNLGSFVGDYFLDAGVVLGEFAVVEDVDIIYLSLGTAAGVGYTYILLAAFVDRDAVFLDVTLGVSEVEVSDLGPVLAVGRGLKFYNCL